MTNFHKCGCTKEKCTYWPPVHNYEGDFLIGDIDKLCTTFFHIMPIWEFDVMEHVCLQEDSFDCRHKNITLIVRVQDANNETLKAVRFTNCIAIGRRPIHAEEFMVVDDSLLIPDTTLTIYNQLQPCHHSGGRDGTYDIRSCTEILIKWYNDKLKPKNITLKIQCGSIYKAVWKDQPSKYGKYGEDIYKTTAQNARDGITLILKSGIDMTMIDDDGWEFLLSQVFENVNITSELWYKKHDVNKKLNDLIKSLV